MLHVNFVDCMEFVTELRGVFCEVLWLHKAQGVLLLYNNCF